MARSLLCAVAFALALLSPVQGQYWSQFERCPQSCAATGASPSNWTHYHESDVLVTCNETLLFDVNLNIPLNRAFHMRACSTGGGPHLRSADVHVDAPPPFGNLTVASTCGSRAVQSKSDVTMGWTSSGSGDALSLSSAVDELTAYLKESTSCGSLDLLAYANKTVVGVHVGGDFQRASAASLVAKFFISQKGSSPSSPGQAFLQTCDSKNSSTTKIQSQNFGIFADTTGNISAVQAAIKTWSTGSGCLDETLLDGGTKTLHGENVGIYASLVETSFSSNISSPTNGTFAFPESGLTRRATCRAVEVVSGDLCSSLASRCGISEKDFVSFNPKANLCTTLAVRQQVCCNKGDVPDPRPKPNADGTCFSHEVKPDEFCYSIADKYYLTTKELEDFNKKTWGWSGCEVLYTEQILCLSSGDPPMPKAISNAVCGPQKPNTPKPAKGTNLESLNPCPLNACCNTWGQCGTTSEFCTLNPSSTGAPGSVKKDMVSCVSNCGMEITNNARGPDQYIRLGYFEAWNKKRDCLHMDVTQMPRHYTHIHFAFATITPDFYVSIKGVEAEQFEKLKGMKDVKRILSFGGWSFSTENTTYQILRSAVSDANRLKFATNVVNYLNEHGLDGLDFDWEYPGAPDIPGVPTGSPNEAQNYLSFLQLVRNRLPSGKTLSIALPASYWYLKAFPVAEMNKVVDYFVYMTYDLHGQWDNGNNWSSPGCPTGNCLRSHVNITETMNALVMVTKAGAETRKLLVGVTSYGRSFGMADPTCDRPECFFTGTASKSTAEPGVCTGTGGYLANAEIDEIRRMGGNSVRAWWDFGSQSDIMTWNGNWVVYMEDSSKDLRIAQYQRLNMGGTSDWAVDLQEYRGAELGSESSGGDGEGVDPIAGVLPTCEGDYKDLESLVRDAEMIPINCRGAYAIEVLYDMLDGIIDKYHEALNGYAGKFKYYAGWVRDMVDPTIREFMKWGAQGEPGPGNKYFSCLFKDEDQVDQYQGKCPPPNHLYPVGRERSYWLYYTLDDAEGFYKDLNETKGIPRDWIKIGNWDAGIVCNPTLDLPPGKADGCENSHRWHRGFPVRADVIDVPDPKEEMERALPSIEDLRSKLVEGSLGLSLTPEYSAIDEATVADPTAFHIFMLNQSVEAMEMAKDIGEKIEKQKQRDKIIQILTIIFMIVPFLGEVGIMLSTASLVTRVALASVGASFVANMALAGADIQNDPAKTPIFLLSLLLGGGPRSLKGAKAFNEAAIARRKLGAADLVKFGSVVQEGMMTVTNIFKACFRK